MSATPPLPPLSLDRTDTRGEAARDTRGPGVDTGPARGLARLTMRLTRARFAAREGESLLYVAGVLAYLVAAALALTVAGGTWMFWTRWRHPHGLIAAVIAEDPSFEAMPGFYLGLAVLACALLVPALVTLTAGAAVLGARGRERRLAALRLLGLSSRDVTRMSLLDALVQSVVGTALGALVYLVTLPLWGNLTMIGMPVERGEMLLPAGLFAAVAVAVIAIGLFAAWRGLRQVRISPLGVARRANKPRLSWLRAVVFVVVAVVATVAVNVLGVSTEVRVWIVLGGVLVALLAAVALVGPWLLQVAARGLAHVPGPTMRWAARRIAADPTATWRRVSGIALLAFIGGYMAFMPIAVDHADDAGDATRTLVESAVYDFTKGAVITLAVGFVLTAVSMLITQASATIERAEQSRALHRMGAPAAYTLRVMWVETFGPLVVAVLLGASLGAAMAMPMYRFAQDHGFGAESPMGTMAAVMGVGLALAATSLLLCHPLYRRLLGAQHRRND